jgi:ATP-dependent RNA circularization protein (DNA/RNA ligase family)
VFTEKVGGTNVRVVCQDGTFEFKGRTDNAQMPAPLMERLRERFLPQAHRFAEKFPDGVCLYGEGYGAKIQSGGKYRPDQDFVLFDVKVGEWWLERQSVEDIADEFGLDVVPIIGHGTFGDMVKMVEQGFKSQWGNFIAEGIVARPEVELKTRSGERIITKLKHIDFKTGW